MRCWHCSALLLCTRAEDPIGADAITYLDGSTWSWHRDDDGFTIPASVPGDVVTDLQAAAPIGDPLLDDNFVRDAPMWNRTWTLRTSFEVDSDAARILLVFDGVKMGASVSLNHVPLGTVRDQFLRYAFDVRNASIDLLRETNKLELIFDPSIDVGGAVRGVFWRVGLGPLRERRPGPGLHAGPLEEYLCGGESFWSFCHAPRAANYGGRVPDGATRRRRF